MVDFNMEIRITKEEEARIVEIADGEGVTEWCREAILGRMEAEGGMETTYSDISDEEEELI